MLKKTKRVIASWIKFQLKKIMRGFVHLSEQDRNSQLLADAEAKATRSSTTWAVKVFEGMKKVEKQITSLRTRDITAN